MKVEVTKYGNTIYIVDKNTSDVICSLPCIMASDNMPSTLKALSILLKGMSVASKKYRSTKSIGKSKTALG